MSFNTIYYGSFNDNVNQDRIDIYIKQKGFSGEPSALLLDANPLVITYPEKEWDSQLFGCGCQINIINQSGNFYKYDSLFSVPERSNYVEIVKTTKAGDSSTLLFQGYILPDMYTSKLDKNIKLTIPATDRLTTLDRYTPAILVDTSTYRADEYLNANDLILTMLMDTDVTNHFYINNTLENINYRRDSSSCIFDNIFFQSDNFHDEENVENSKKCMEKILKSFYSRVFYHDGKWKIERIKDMGLTSKRYTYYPPNSPTTSVDVSNNRIDLTCGNYEIINSSPELSYNPGYNKMVVNLKYKQPETLVENYFYDIEPLDTSNMSNGKYPLPQYRRWMVSDKSLTNYQGTWDGFLTTPDSSLWTFPITWNPDFTNPPTMWMYAGLWGSSQIRAEWADDQVLSTMFQFSPQQPGDELIINLRYKVATDVWQSGPNNAVFRTRFALRACDSNGKDWWIAKMNPNDTSTYWKDTPYTFDTSIMKSDLMAENPGKSFMLWEISKEINISSPIFTDVSICKGRKRRRSYITINDSQFFYNSLFNRYETYTYTVPTNPGYISQLYLDVYMFERTYPGLGGYLEDYNPYYAYFGDFDLDIATKIPKSYLEASMGYWYNTITRELDIFDTDTVLLTNGIYNCDASLNLRSISGWRDSSTENYISLAEQYIQDMAQMVDRPKYNLSIDVRSKDSYVLGLHNIFTHNSLRYPDDSLIEFMCNGLQYNVKENIYRLSLMEYISDNNWRVNPMEYYFDIDTSSLQFNYLGFSNDKIVELNTNVPSWIVSSSEAWIDTSISGYGPLWYITVNASTNSGNRRDGSVWFIPTSGTDVSPKVVSVRQDPSTNVNVGFDINRYVTVSNNEAIDVSILCYVYAYACSELDLYTSYVQMSYKSNVVVSASAEPIQGDCEDNDASVMVSDKGLTDASNNRITYSGTSYSSGSYGEKYSTGYAVITKAVISGTTTDVSLLNNRIDWDYLGQKHLSTEV